MLDSRDQGRDSDEDEVKSKIQKITERNDECRSQKGDGSSSGFLE